MSFTILLIEIPAETAATLRYLVGHEEGYIFEESNMKTGVQRMGQDPPVDLVITQAWPGTGNLNAFLNNVQTQATLPPPVVVIVPQEPSSELVEIVSHDKRIFDFIPEPLTPEGVQFTLECIKNSEK